MTAGPVAAIRATGSATRNGSSTIPPSRTTVSDHTLPCSSVTQARPAPAGTRTWARRRAPGSTRFPGIATARSPRTPSCGGRARSHITGSTTFFSAKHPQRAAALALIDYSPDNAPAGTKRTTEIVGNTPDAFPSMEAARAYLGPKKSLERYEHYLKNLSVKRDPFFRDQFKKVLAGGERPKLGVDMWQVLGEVRCPVLSVRGKKSDMYAPETVAKMKAANPRLEVVEVDAGHDIAGENEAALVEAIKGAMRQWIPGE